jgi:hypothetical protein
MTMNCIALNGGVGFYSFFFVLLVLLLLCAWHGIAAWHGMVGMMIMEVGR